MLLLPEFRRLWLAGLLISIARWAEMLVVSVFVFQATGSAFLVAGMMLLRLAPMGLLGVLLGVLADRVPRRRALQCVVAAQGLAVGAMALLAALDALQVWQVALACCLGGLGWATDNPVRRMMVGEAVGAARMGSAMSLDVVANNASRIAGPSLGGTLLALLGPAQAFGLAFLLYLLTLAIVLRIRIGAVAATRRPTPVLTEMREAVGLALRLPRLRAVLLVTVIYNLFGWPCTSMVPVVGQVAFGLNPEGLGLLASMEGLGALLGAFVVGALARPERYALVYLVGTAVFMAMLVAFALSPTPVPAGLALLVMGMGSAGFGTMQATLIYLGAAPEQRGRALGVLSTAIGTGLLGFLYLGALAEWLGAPAATAIVAGQGLLVLALTRRWWLPLFERDRPESSDDSLPIPGS